MNYICVDGKTLPAGQPVLHADNRGYRYGDGLFETMKVIDGKICLADFHFNRFFAGLRQLQFTIPPQLDAVLLVQQSLRLCKMNECSQLARVRLSASRGNGGLYDGNDTLHYIIECWPLPVTVNQLNENGLAIGVFPGAQKACDVFANLKSANYLPSVMATKYAAANQWNDCLLLNQHRRIAEATIANVFLIKSGVVFTPPLTEGCVDGVMRKHIMEKLTTNGYSFREQAIGQDELPDADELFLTNAVHGIRWVKQLGDTQYRNLQTSEIYSRFVQPVFLY